MSQDSTPTHDHAGLFFVMFSFGLALAVVATLTGVWNGPVVITEIIIITILTVAGIRRMVA